MISLDEIIECGEPDPDFFYFDPETGEPLYDDYFENSYDLFDPEKLDEDLPFD